MRPGLPAGFRTGITAGRRKDSHLLRFSQRRDAAGWPSLPAPLLRQGFLSRCADTPRSPSQRLRKRSIQPVPRQARPGFRLPHQTPVRPEAALSRRQLVFTVLRPVTAVERAHFRLRSDFGGSAGTTATRTLSGRHGNLTGGFRIQRRPPFLSGLLQYFKPRKRGGRNAAPPLTLKNTEENRCGTRKTAERKREPPKKKKVCWREEEETATERERPPEGKREPPKNEKAGRWEGRAVMGREKSAKKSGRKPVSQLSKRTKTALSGTCRSGKVLLSLCRFTETVPIWPKHSIYS